MAGKEAEYGSHVEEFDETCRYLGCTHTLNANRTVIDEHGKCSNYEFLLELLVNCRNLTQKLSHGHAIWKDMRKSALRGSVSCQ